MNRSTAEIVREYGPFPGADRVHGVTYDGKHVWFASGDKLHACLTSKETPERRDSEGYAAARPPVLAVSLCDYCRVSLDAAV